MADSLGERAAPAGTGSKHRKRTTDLFIRPSGLHYWAMSPLLRYLLLAAAPTAAFLLAEKAVRAVSSYDSQGPLAPLPTRDELSASCLLYTSRCV